MSSQFPYLPQFNRLAPQALARLAGGQRHIARIVGFFPDEVRAQQAFSRLRHEVGLPSVHLAMLKPRDGEGTRFDQVARAWRANRPAQRVLRPEHRSWGLILGAVIGALLNWVITMLDPGVKAAAAMVALPIGAAWGAVVGILMVVLLERLPQPHRFDRQIQRQLLTGAHAVVVLRVPEQCQADVLALMRGHSQGWCAEAPRNRRPTLWRGLRRARAG